MQLLKRSAKDVIKLSLIAATAAVVTPALAQTPAAAAAAPVAAAPDNLYAVAKFPPLPKFTENLMAVARKVEPGPNTEMLPMFMFGAFGYPSFPGVSATEGVTAFCFKGAGEEQPLAFVVLAKIEADSPVLAALSGPPLNLKSQVREGWTLLAQDESAFAAVKDFQALVRIATGPSDFAVELRAYVNKATRGAVAELIDGLAAGQEPAVAAKTKAWQQLLFRVLGNYTSFGYGLSFDADTVALGIVGDAIAGSPDAELIAAPLPAAAVAAGEALGAEDSLFSLVGRMDVPATKAYLTWARTLVTDIPEEKARELAQEVIGLYDKFLEQWDGNYASSMVALDLENGQSNSLSVISGSFTQEQLDEINTYTVEKVVPEFFNLIKTLTGEDTADFFKATVQSKAETLDGQSVTKIATLTLNPEAADGQVAQDTYYTVVKGAMLSANKLDSLRSLVAAYSAGEPVANNLATALPLAAGNMARGLVDIKAISKQLMAAAAAEEGADAGGNSKQIAALIEQAKVDPAALLVDTRDTRIVYSLSLPVDSLVAIVNTYKAIDALEAPATEVIEVEVQTTTGN